MKSGKSQKQEEMNVGDIITISGVYKKRTFIEFIKKKPKELKKFVVEYSITDVK